jgi:phosphocarrier protein HPr
LFDLKKKPRAGHGPPSVPTVRQTFAVNLKYGLHVRPCALLVKTLWPFHCRVDVAANGEQASGHSIMSLLALGASYQTKVTFTMTGEDAAQALTAVHRLFDSHFEDAYRTATEPARAAPVLSKT